MKASTVPKSLPWYDTKSPTRRPSASLPSAAFASNCSSVLLMLGSAAAVLAAEVPLACGRGSAPGTARSSACGPASAMFLWAHTGA